MRTRIAIGVGALLAVVLAVVLAAVLAAVLAPRVVGPIMITFSVIAFLWAAIGLLKPSWARLPNRMAAVWVWALSFGLFLGGGALLAPPPEVSNSNGLTAAETPEERERERERERPTMAAQWAPRVTVARLDQTTINQFYRQMPPEEELEPSTERRSGGRVGVRWTFEDESWIEADFRPERADMVLNYVSMDPVTERQLQ